MGPNKDKYVEGTTVSAEPGSKSFLKPGLNVGIYCGKCKKKSKHQWGFRGIKGNMEQGFNLDDLMEFSKCQHCQKSIYDDDDVKVTSFVFYKD